MTAIETKAYFEENGTIRLADPVFPALTGAVRIIVLFDEKPGDSDQWAPNFLTESYGSCADAPLECVEELVFEKNRVRG